MSQRPLLGANPAFWRRLREEGEQWLRPYLKPFEARVIAVDAASNKAKVALPGESADPVSNRRPLYPVIGAMPEVGQTAWCLVWFAGGIVVTGGGGSAPGPTHSFSAWQSVAQTDILNATVTPITFDTEEWDASNAFAASTFTAPEDGEYAFNGGTFLSPGVDQKLVRLHLVNGDNSASLRILFYGQTSGVSGTGAYGPGNLMLLAGATVRLAVWHNFATTGTANPDTFAGQAFTYFQGHKVGPYAA